MENVFLYWLMRKLVFLIFILPYGWVTVELRNQSAVNTIRNKLGTIQWVMNWEKRNNLVISNLIHNKVLLTESQLESLIRHMRINVKKQKNVINTKKVC